MAPRDVQAHGRAGRLAGSSQGCLSHLSLLRELRHPYLCAKRSARPQLCKRGTLHCNPRAAERAGREGGGRFLLSTAKVRLVLEPVGGCSLPTHVPRCKVAFCPCFYTFQSSSGCKRRLPNLLWDNPDLGSALHQCRPIAFCLSPL